MLWAKSWQSAPCGTWPANDELIAARIGMPYRQFKAHRDILMRGWYQAADGKLYHPVIVDLVLGMTERRIKDRNRMSAWRSQSNQALSPNVTRDSHVSHALVTPLLPPPPPLPIPKRKRKDKDTLGVAELVSLGVHRQHAQDWLRNRTVKRLPLTKTALAQVEAEAAKASLTLPQAIQRAAEQGWAGFKAHWSVEPVRGSTGKQTALEAANQAAAHEWLARTSRTTQ